MAEHIDEAKIPFSDAWWSLKGKEYRLTQRQLKFARADFERPGLTQVQTLAAAGIEYNSDATARSEASRLANTSAIRNLVTHARETRDSLGEVSLKPSAFYLGQLHRIATESRSEQSRIAAVKQLVEFQTKMAPEVDDGAADAGKLLNAIAFLLTPDLAAQAGQRLGFSREEVDAFLRMPGGLFSSMSSANRWRGLAEAHA